MKATHPNKRLKFFFATVCLVLPCAMRAQSPPGPMTGAPAQPVPAEAAKPAPPLPPPRTTILGAWKLNRDESDDTRKKRDESSDSNTGGYGGRRGGMGGGYPGGGHGGYGRRGESDEERQKMHELLSPPEKMTLSMTGAEVDLLEDRDRKRAFMTDGRKLQKSKDDSYREIAAKWDGDKLATEEKDPRGNKMSRTFELSDDGRQLYEVLHMTSGRNNTPRVIRFVYDIPLQTEAQTKQ
jgi:type IV secretory pathway VirB10-like protein